MIGASYGATNSSKMPRDHGGTGVAAAELDEVVGRPLHRTTNISLRRWRIRSNSWTQAGSSYVARISRSTPTRQAASCQQPGWPKTSKQQMWPRTMPRFPPKASGRPIDLRDVALCAGRTRRSRRCRTFAGSAVPDPDRVLVGGEHGRQLSPRRHEAGAHCLILGVRHGLGPHPPPGRWRSSGRLKKPVFLERARSIRRPTRPADVRRPTGSRPCRNGQRTPGAKRRPGTSAKSTPSRDGLSPAAGPAAPLERDQSLFRRHVSPHVGKWDCPLRNQSSMPSRFCNSSSEMPMVLRAKTATAGRRKSPSWSRRSRRRHKRSRPRR